MSPLVSHQSHDRKLTQWTFWLTCPIRPFNSIIYDRTSRFAPFFQVTTSGTEGNLHGILVAREVLPNAILYASKESHCMLFHTVSLGVDAEMEIWTIFGSFRDSPSVSLQNLSFCTWSDTNYAVSPSHDIVLWGGGYEFQKTANLRRNEFRKIVKFRRQRETFLKQQKILLN
jgi:hypothetical protein